MTTDFIDAESDFKNENNSFKDIVMRQVERIATHSAFEYYHGGRYEIRGKNQIEMWVPDGKDVYCNLVNTLYCMIHVYFDKEMIEIEEKFKEELKKAKFKRLDSPEKDDVADMIFLRERYETYATFFKYLCGFLKRVRYFESVSVEDN